MSEATNLSPFLNFSLPPQTKTSVTDQLIYNHSTLKLSNPTHVFKTLSLHKKLLAFRFPVKIQQLGGKIGVIYGFGEEGSFQEEIDDDDLPISVELVPICSETQFERVIAEAQQLEESVIVVWMASWCRKCIYLKPKLEKLAADYYPRLRFYCIDVNNVPHKLVTRAGVTKMPTIQLWKDGQKQAEVIGGHKAHFVISEVRQMIENPDFV